MPAKFSFSFSTRWNLARSRRDDFPASPDFSQLESGRGVNLVRTFSRTLAQFNRAVRYRRPWRQETKALDSNIKHGSLQLTAKRRSVPALNRLAACPQNSRASTVRGILRVQTRIRFHVARIPGALDRFYQRHDAPTVGHFAHCTTKFSRVSHSIGHNARLAENHQPRVICTTTNRNCCRTAKSHRLVTS
jgi:hypothetical protein